MERILPRGLSLPHEIISKIDKERGDIPRSRYLLKILDKVYSSKKLYEGSDINCDTQDSRDCRADTLALQEPRRKYNTCLGIPMEHGLSNPDVTNHICEAVNCNAKATAEIQVEIGRSKWITLSLCNNCVNKFSNSAEPEAEEIEKI